MPEFSLFYRVFRVAEFEFDNVKLFRSSPCQPILRKHCIFVSTYTRNIKMSMKRWFLGVFGDAEFEFDLKKYFFITGATYTYKTHVLVNQSYINYIFWGFQGR